VAEAEWVEINAIKPWEKNPRKNAAAVKEVAGSIKRFGFSSPIIVRRADGVIIAGHTRYAAAQSLGLDKVLVRYMDLDPAQAKALALADNKIGEIADWDRDLLSEILRELDEEAFDVSGLGFSDGELDRLLSALADDAGEIDPDPINEGPAPKAEVKTPESSGPAAPAVDVPPSAAPAQPPAAPAALSDTYTKKVKAPIYTPKGNAPALGDCYDEGKANTLIAQIDAAGLAPDLSAFLRAAARRHVVFSYRNIAELYCHQPAAVQDLFERSALVIIDFDKAIENGFVHLTERLGALADAERAAAAGASDEG
jgi:hypothetical protein